MELCRLGIVVGDTHIRCSSLCPKSKFEPHNHASGASSKVPVLTRYRRCGRDVVDMQENMIGSTATDVSLQSPEIVLQAEFAVQPTAVSRGQKKIIYFMRRLTWIHLRMIVIFVKWILQQELDKSILIVISSAFTVSESLHDVYETRASAS